MKSLHLHKLDGDHEGLLWVGPVQLPGSVADLSEAGGQVHGRCAVLGQFTQGHQLRGEGAERRAQGWPDSCPSLPPSFHRHSEPLPPPSRWAGGHKGKADSTQTPRLQRSVWKGKPQLKPRVSGGSGVRTTGLKSWSPTLHILEVPAEPKPHSRAPILGPEPTSSIRTARCTRARATL